ncbi:glycosyltransferase family 87 protein [Streptomyces sp. TS71-3]|uniref:glycosyltransferase 87 family protein n=1 Tax=Streptomyces sp. TS71-3 TaxID=2733862 RepID=UPI001BB3CAC6
MAARTARGIPAALWVVGAWAATRVVLLLWVLGALRFPGLDVTGDVSVIYHGWYEVLRTGHFPASDVAWQYPPGAALAVLSPALLPFLPYATAFFVLLLVADALVLGMLLRAARRPDRTVRGAWVWVVGVPLLGPTGYARYDLMVTAVGVAALLAGVHRPRLLGALAAFGALLKVWPALVLLGTRRGRATVRSWVTAAVVAAGLLLGAWAVVPGALSFLRFQEDRGTEVESLGALVLHVARNLGWPGEVALRYGSVEFLGPYVELVSTLAQVLSVLALGWLLVWRWRAGTWSAGTLADAAFTAVLMFTTTSRVISPQYMVWLVGLAAVCLLFRAGPMVPSALMVLAASLVTTLEFPVFFDHVVASDDWGILLLAVRNALLLAATVTAAAGLWRRTVRPFRRGAGEPGSLQEPEELVGSR